MKREKTNLEKAYKKETNKINKLIAEAEKSGVKIPKRIKKRLAKNPKRYTEASVNSLKGIREEVSSRKAAAYKPKIKAGKKAKKEKTEKQKEYEREARRIKSFIRRAEKRGYVFSDKFKADTGRKLNVYTARSVERLKKMSPEYLYGKSKYRMESGKLISGREGRYLEREAAAYKAKKTREERRKKLFELKVKEDITPDKYVLGELKRSVLKLNEYLEMNVTHEELARYVGYLQTQQDFLDTIDKTEEHKKAQKALRKGMRDAIEAYGIHDAVSVLENLQPWGVYEIETGHDIYDDISFDVEQPEPEEPQPVPEPEPEEPQQEAAAEPEPEDPGDYADDWIIFNFKHEIHDYGHLIRDEALANRFVQKLDEWVDSLITTYGRVAVANMIQNAEEAGVRFGAEVAYNGQLLMTTMYDYLKYLGMDDDRMETIDDMRMSLEEAESWEPYD